MDRRPPAWLAAIPALLLAGAAGAQPAVPASAAAPPSGLEDLSLEELMAVPVAVAAPSHPQGQHDTPGIVTVLTRDEILGSGCRDLIDVLNLVPGVQFGSDVQGVVGIGFRGVWGHEGKVLLRVDGQEMNELDYSTTQFGNRFPIDQIERVEVIRGPGSVVYGGFAELAVINVVTRSAEDLHGASATATYGRMQHGLGRQTLSLLAASPVKGVDGMSVSVGGYFGDGNRSDGTYRDFAGKTWNMRGDSAIDPRFLNVGLKYKDLSLRFMLDAYRMTTRDGFGDVLPATVEQTFPSYYGEAKYAWKLLDGRLVIVPRFTYKAQMAWRVTDPASALFEDRFVERYVAGVTASGDPIKSLNLMGGLEGTFDRAGLNQDVIAGLQRRYSNGRTSVAYQDFAALAQILWTNPIVNVTAGGRFEIHSQYGSSVVPRVSLTKTYRWFWAKLEYSQAFRAPGIQNYAINPAIGPEKTTNYEAEIGAHAGRYLMVAVSAFDVRLDHPIVYDSYQVGSQLVETYRNLTRTGSCGVDAEIRLKHPRVWATLAYSWYTPKYRNTVDEYRVPGRDDVVLGFAAHKVTFHSAFHVTDHFHVSPSLVFLSDRYTCAGEDVNGVCPTKRLGPTVELNLYAEYRDLGIRGLAIGVGVFNLLDQDIPYIQPYDGGHAPLPGPSREFVGRINYTYAF